ncbi:MAG TPA: MarR family transcriptional regulator [Thermoanaerobaculia bacterium]|nr:MarR family transcriptional regulator [Thermoanaerobaculia bacterium]
MVRVTDIADEIKQTRSFKDKSTEAALALLRTASLLRRKAEAITLREGISLQQYNVLRILRGARGPLPTMEIAARLVEPAPGITRFVNSLEEKGLIRREQWPGDRRQVLCQITAAGLKLLERLDGDIDKADSEATGELSGEQIDVLLDFLSEIRRANAP